MPEINNNLILSPDITLIRCYFIPFGYGYFMKVRIRIFRFFGGCRAYNHSSTVESIEHQKKGYII